MKSFISHYHNKRFSKDTKDDIYKGEDIRNGGQFFRRYEPDMHLTMLHIFNIPEENSLRNIPHVHQCAVP